MLKFVVLSDIHLVPKGELSHGLDTHDRLTQAVAFVNERHSDADFVVFAGDLADHGLAASYERFKSAIAPLTAPVYLTLGNHDDRQTFLDIFGADQAAETGCIDHVIDLKGYRVIVLDSFDPTLKDGSGRLDPGQITWLQARLDEAADRPVIVVLHHTFAPFHIQTDFIILQDPDTFAQVMSSHPDVRQIISGHVHMTVSGTYRGLPFCTFAGAHYSIDPTLESRSGPVPNLVPRREGPGQLAVVLANEDAVVVHNENFLDRHLVLAPDLFKWS